MDISESPTQANDDRDYETARHSVYDPEPEPELSSHEAHTLRDDDTGAVNFGPLTQEKAASPLSDVLSPLVVTRESWRDSQPDEPRRDAGTTPARPAFAPPETPVAVVNPFQNKGASILRATQLFNATQVSAAKGFSPTSSRPSPHTFPPPFMSTSPADLGTSPLKHRHPLSSPSGLRDSTPLGPPTSFLVPTPRRDEGEAIPESPTDGGPPRKRRRQELLEEYEPVALSQERKLFEAVDGTDEESEVESGYWRRQRVKRIREDAERQLDEVSYKLSRERPFRRVASSPHVSAKPSSPRGARSRQRSEGPILIPASSGSLPRIPRSSSPGDQRGDATSSRALVPESPVMVPESDFAEGVPSDDAPEGTQGQEAGRGLRGEGDEMPPTQSQWSSREACPPLPVLDEELPPTHLPPSKPEAHPSPSPAPDPKPAPALDPSSSPPASNPSSPPNSRPSPVPGSSPPPAPDPNRTIQPTRASTPPGSPQSSLSPLTATPSPVTTPKATTPSPGPDCYDLPGSADFDLPPPRPNRKPTKKSYLRPPARKSIPRSRRASVAPDRGTDSPDELATAPAQKRRSRSARLPEGPALFENMAFAISFQGRREGEAAEEYDARCEASERLARLVARAGGRVLSDGFNALLDVGAGGVELADEARDLGFTALLADGHSRKVKYMQALALGLPCLAYQWATGSLEKGELQDWTPYLLSPGESAVLGGAVLSRQLSPYPASVARLPDVISRRTLLLGGDRILLVMKKARGAEAGKAYLSLARIVGARVTRVYSVREGRKALGKGGFEWVYVDEETGGKGLGEGVRFLSNELIIQSLIAGRVVGEREGEAHGL